VRGGSIIAPPMPGATVTVRTPRGETYTIDVEAACKGLAELHSNAANEERFGWSLNEAWYVAELQWLYACAIDYVAPYKPAPTPSAPSTPTLPPEEPPVP
jgi:hypothetical protein